jgi:hypothetical protein
LKRKEEKGKVKGNLIYSKRVYKKMNKGEKLNKNGA